MRLINLFVVAAALVSCANSIEESTTQKETSEKKSEEINEPNDQKTTTDFYCEVDGRELIPHRRYCIRKESFSYYDFWFIDTMILKDVHIMLDFSVENKELLYVIRMGNDPEADYEATMYYSDPPEGYSLAKTENTITITKWDKDNKTISLEFEGTVGADGSDTYHTMKGSLKGVVYE